MENTRLTFVRRLFHTHGISEEPKRLSGGWTNEVYAAGDLVLRCTGDMKSGRLILEAQLASRLPPEAGYPEIIGSGSTAECVWMLCKRIPGVNLEDAWGLLSLDERADALEQLWSRVSHVHRIDAEAARPYAGSSLWYFSSAEHALEEAQSLREKDLLNQAELDAAKVIIDRFSIALQQAPCVVVHGDLTPANAMWHEGRITALMDFECAAIAPREADLMMLLNTAYERLDLPQAANNPADRQRFNARMRALVQAAAPDWNLLQGYEVIKLIHHVFMDMEDEDFSPSHEELTCLLAVLMDGRGMLQDVLP